MTNGNFQEFQKISKCNGLLSWIDNTVELDDDEAYELAKQKLMTLLEETRMQSFPLLIILSLLHRVPKDSPTNLLRIPVETRRN